MKTYSRRTGEDRKFVVFEVVGRTLRVAQGSTGVPARKKHKEFASEAQALLAQERMIEDLVAKGFAERASVATRRAERAAAGSSRAVRAPEPDSRYADLFEAAGEGDATAAEGTAVLSRLAPNPAAPAKPRKKGGKRKKKRGTGEGTAEALDKRVVAGIGAGAFACCAIFGFLGYDMFFKPPSIVGSWEGSRTEHEIGKFLTHDTYALLLDGQARAVMTREGKFTSKGTYTVQGDRLRLNFPAEKIPKGDEPKVEGEAGEAAEGGEPGEAAEGGEPIEEAEDVPASDLEYQIVLGRATLDLYDPASGKKVVQLIRMTKKVGSGSASAAAAAPAEAPKDLGAGGGDKAADAALASVRFEAVDGAFRMQYPPGWKMEFGGRPDGSYSWGRFHQGPRQGPGLRRRRRLADGRAEQRQPPRRERARPGPRRPRAVPEDRIGDVLRLQGERPRPFQGRRPGRGAGLDLHRHRRRHVRRQAPGDPRHLPDQRPPGLGPLRGADEGLRQAQGHLPRDEPEPGPLRPYPA